MTEEKMARLHHQLNGHEFEQTPGDSEGQGTVGVLTKVGGTLPLPPGPCFFRLQPFH